MAVTLNTKELLRATNHQLRSNFHDKLMKMDLNKLNVRQNMALLDFLVETEENLIDTFEVIDGESEIGFKDPEGPVEVDEIKIRIPG